MNNFINRCKEFMQDEEGLTIVEYVIGAALLVAAFALADPWAALSGNLTAIINGIGA
ncbi:hypothetical protein [Aliivibrio fischeri]|uniref:hypothetical protein n=1 Tax=Aliivibrio fischeri TaxID=668 RepID=UPI00159F281B|nr:hypothetical protein [Aliivibrio fischeri]